MNATPSSLRLAARLARREVRRRPGRTALVALLVAIPVVGMTVAAAFVRTDHQTPMESWRAQWGAADAGQHVTPEQPGPELPAGSRVVEYRVEHRLLRDDAGRRSRAEVSDLPVTDPIADGILQVTSGRLPTSPGEAFVSRASARRLRVGVGDELRLVRPVEVSLRVTAVGERASWWGSELVVVAPGTPALLAPGGRPPDGVVRLVDLPASTSAAELEALAISPAGLMLAPDLLAASCVGSCGGGSGGDEAVAWSWVIGTVVLVVVGIVIASAFAAGARRQLTTLGQLAANGAAPAVLRRVLFLQGTWTGLIGAALGLMLAAVALAALAPHADAIVGRDVDPWRIQARDLIPVVLLGVAAASIAALVPAGPASRVPVLAALAGRRPLRPVPGWVPAAGAAVVACGLALLGLAVLGANQATGGADVWALTAIAGGVAVLLGACAVAPAYVSLLEPVAGRLRGASRLAARSLARQRTRTGAVVSAVCATAALAIAASGLVLAAQAKADAEPVFLRDDEVQLQAFAVDATTTPPAVAEVAPELVDHVAATLPDARRLDLSLAVAPDPTWRWVAVDTTTAGAGGPHRPEGMLFLHGGGGGAPAVLVDEAALAVYGLTRREREVLAEEGVLAFGQVDGRASLTLVSEPLPQVVLPSGPGGASGAVPATPVPPGGTAAAPRVVVEAFPIAVAGLGDRAVGALPHLLMTRERAATLGFVEAAGPIVFRQHRPLTADQRDSIADAVGDYFDAAFDASPAGLPVHVDVAVLHPSGGVDPLVLEAILSGLALLFSLFVVAVSLALAAAETRDERDVLAVVGAPPSTMWRTSGRKAVLLTVLGAVLAIPIGFLPVSVFTAASADDLPLVFPWRIVLALVLVVPLVAGMAATAGSALAARLRPIRVSTMAFD